MRLFGSSPTVARFKWPEAQAVILWLGDEVIDDEQWDTVYVGATKAKSLHCLVGSSDVLKALRTTRASNKKSGSVSATGPSD